MAVTNISNAWNASYWLTPFDAAIDDVDFSSPPDTSDSFGGGLSVTSPPDTGSEATTYASRFTSSFTTDSAGETTFHLTVCGAAEVYIDGVKVIDLTSSVLPGAGSDGCLSTGANICHCNSTENKVSGAVKLDLAAGEHTVEVRYLDHPLSDGLYFGWDTDNSGGQEFDLTIPTTGPEDASEIGEWGEIIDTTIMGIHQVLLGDGRVLYWGDGGEGDAFSGTQKFAIFDPTTGTHEVLDASFQVRMFCGAGILLPGTDKILIGGGNGSGLDDGKIFDLSDGELVNAAQYTMDVNRFYPTTVSLATGQVVILGGDGAGNATPEIFTLGQGWHRLEGATDQDVSGSWWYPKAWVNNKGEIVYIAVGGGSGGQNGGTNAAGTFEVMALDASGDGSVRQIGEVPFRMDVRSGAVMYDIGKIVVMDHEGDLWYMDINGDEPTFSFALDLPRDRENGDMTVMADGRILLNGGTTTGNSQDYANAQLQSVIFDPYSGQVSFVDSEAVLRTYHSSSILLPDGTIMSSGGGGLGGLLNFQNAQIYKPDYLFNDDGSLADRPEISLAPAEVVPGQSFVITVDDAATIARMSFVKTGAVTHSINMESGRMDLDFTVLSPTEIAVSLPDNPHVVGAGNWMLFAIDDQGVPSVAPIISVQPTLEPFNFQAGSLNAEYFVLDTGVTSLGQIDFNQTADQTDTVSMVNFNTVNGSGYIGGPSDYFAAKYTGTFDAPTAGDFTFYLTSDDGSQLFINGQLIIDNDGVQAATEIAQTISLSAGSHTIELRYFEAAGEAVLDLDWAGPGFAREQMMFESGPAISITAPADVTEGDSGDSNSLVFTVTLSEVSAVDVVADVLIDGASGPTQVTIPAGQTSVEISATFQGDDVYTGDRLVTVTLSNVQNARSDDLVASARILEDEPAPPTLMLSAPGDVVEGAAGETGTMVFTVSLDKAWNADVTADVAISGNVTGPANIIIPAGQTSATITLSFDGDNVSDGNETISVTLSNVQNAIGTDLSASAQILDDDTPLLVPMTVEYFSVPSTTSALSQIDFNAQPISTQTIEEINFNVGSGSFYAGGPTDNFAARFTGNFAAETSGPYTFYLTSDDGSRLFIDGVEVINNDGLHADVLIQQTITLDAGVHDIEVRYFERGGQATVDLEWAGPGFGRTQMRFEGEPLPVLTLSAPADAAEGDAGDVGTMVFTLSLDKAVAADVVADVQIDGATGPTQVTIPAGQTTAQIVATFQGDNDADGDETVTVTLSNLQNATTTAPSASAIILDDDTTVILQNGFDNGADGFGYSDDAFKGSNAPGYASGSYDANGGQTGGGLAVTLGGQNNTNIFGMSGGWSETFTLDQAGDVNFEFAYNLDMTLPYENDEVSEILVAIDGVLIGIDGEDSIVSIAGGGSTGWQTVSLDLGFLEAGNHTIQVGAYNNKKTYNNEITTARFDDFKLTQVKVPAPDLPVLTVTGPADANEGDAGDSGSLVFTISLDKVSSVDVTADVAFTGDVTGPASITIPAGQLSADLVLGFDGDNVDEPDEAVTVTLSNLQNADPGANLSASATILDDDLPLLPLLSIAAPQDVQEGDAGQSGTLTYVVTLDKIWNFDVTANVAISGDATGPSTITIPAGQLSADLVLSFDGDNLDEPDETVTVTLSNLQNADPGANLSASATILDDDLPPLPLLSIAAPQDTQEGDAGQSGTLTYVVSLDKIWNVDVTANVAISGDATGPSTITIPAGQLSADLVLSFDGDDLDEPDETVTVTLSNLQNADPGANLTASATILDDDLPPLPQLSIAATQDVQEGDAGQTGTLTYVVTLDKVWNVAVTATVAISGNANGPTTITIPAGQTSANLVLNFDGDDVDEPDETVTVTLSNLQNAEPGTSLSASSTILDDDDAPNNSAPVVTYEIPDQAADPGVGWQYEVPVFPFFDADGDAISVSVVLADGSPLPDWLSFNPSNGVFSGTPPADLAGDTITFRLVGSDGIDSVGILFDLAIAGGNTGNSAPVEVFCDPRPGRGRRRNLAIHASGFSRSRIRTATRSNFPSPYPTALPCRTG